MEYFRLTPRKKEIELGNLLIGMDLEMTGLNIDKHVILEIATLITNDNLEIVAQGTD